MNVISTFDSHIFKGDSWCVSWFDKNFMIGFFTDTVQASFFQTLCCCNLAWCLPVYTRFDDLDLVSRSEMCQNHTLQIVFMILVHRSLNIVTGSYKTYMKKIRHSKFFVAGVYLRDVTNTMRVIWVFSLLVVALFANSKHLCWWTGG